MIGPTGVGKTEIARRLAQIARAPFVKVEATKFTEVGYVGRDVDSMVRDLVAHAVRMVESERTEAARGVIEERVESQFSIMLDCAGRISRKPGIDLRVRQRYRQGASAKQHRSRRSRSAYARARLQVRTRRRPTGSRCRRYRSRRSEQSIRASFHARRNRRDGLGRRRGWQRFRIPPPFASGDRRRSDAPSCSSSRQNALSIRHPSGARRSGAPNRRG